MDTRGELYREISRLEMKLTEARRLLRKAGDALLAAHMEKRLRADIDEFVKKVESE